MSSTHDAAREFMADHGVDGWLTRDYRYSNPVFEAALGAKVRNLTRPVWLIIPTKHEPVLLAHEVDAGRFPDGSPEIRTYSNRVQMVEQLKGIIGLCGRKPRLAMEYSPLSELPRVSRVDAGTIELVRSLGPEVVPSGDVLQYATERWSPAQLESHRHAVEALTRIVRQAFDFVGENVRWKLTEHDVAEFIRGRFERSGLEWDDGPVVAFNAHSSDPHYEPNVSDSAVIRREGWLLIDLWARQTAELPTGEPAISADITWVAKLGGAPTSAQLEVFNAVKAARDGAFEFLETCVVKGRHPEGWELDRKAREVITKAGYGDSFVHRLGHSLGHEVHSNGVNLDDWETHDTRTVIQGIGVTIEPGVYLPDFGVRLEMDVYMGVDGPEITGDRQDEIIRVATS